MKCPKCNQNTLEINEEWDLEFDRLDKNVPDPLRIRTILNEKGIPVHFCTNEKCDYKEYDF